MSNARCHRWALLLALPLALAGGVRAQVSIRVNRILQVSAVGTAAENCQALRDTLGSITDSSAAKRYLVRLEPGSFDCGNTTVEVPQGVTIEGSGPELTTVEGGVDAALIGVVHMADNTALRSLRVNNFNSNPTFGAIAVSAWKIGGSLSGVRLDRVELEANLLNGADAGTAILGIDASLLVTSSSLLSQTDVAGGSLDLRFSTLQVLFPGAGPKVCHSCTAFFGDQLTTSCGLP